MTPAKGGQPSLLAPNFKLAGDLDSQGDLQIDGEVEGNVNATRLVIGESGRVKGKVTAADIYVAGHIEGEIAAGRLQLSSSANIEGKVRYETLTIDEGGVINGNCQQVVPKAKMGGSSVGGAGASSAASFQDKKPADPLVKSDTKPDIKPNGDEAKK